MLELQNVYKYYSNNGVTNKGLINVNLKLNRGEIVVITGESGSGKSTLLNVITKVDTFDEGEIYYLGNETSFFSVDDMDYFRKNKIGFIFQNYNIVDSYTVLQNVMLPLIINGVSIKEAKAEAMEIIKKVGLEKWAHNRGTKLSGGQKQRCVIARALASRCEILACDEPTGNLDSQTGAEIVELIKEVAQDKLVLIVTHNYEQFASIATRKIKVHDGEIVEDSVIENVKEDESKELDLEYVPVKRKTNAVIAASNLKSTPRKTILMSLIIFFTAFFALFLYQSIVDTVSNGYKSNPFIYQGTNKIIAYDKNHNTIDVSSFDNYVTNEFYLTEDDTSFSCYRKNSNHTDSIYLRYESNVDKYEIVSGTKPQNDNEVIVVFSSDDFSKKSLNIMWEDYSKSSLIFQTDDRKVSDFQQGKISFYCDESFKVSGLALSSHVEETVITGSSKLKLIQKAMYLQKSTGWNVLLDLSQSTKIYTKDGEKLPNSTYFGKDLYNVDKLKGVSEVNETYEYIIAGSDIEEFENIYEVSLYGKKESIIKKAKQNGLNYINISKYDDSTAMDRFMGNIISYISVILLTFVILLVYLITSIILLRVFSSKLETYAIFRTLGITKKDMKNILKNEIMILVVSITILNYVVFFILGKIFKKDNFLKMFSHITFRVTIFYFIIMLLIGLLMARRFNKKLFKSSVSKTLREGD